jgi:hypothetical protein
MDNLQFELVDGTVATAQRVAGMHLVCQIDSDDIHAYTVVDVCQAADPSAFRECWTTLNDDIIVDESGNPLLP